MCHTVRLVLEPAVTLPVACRVGRARIADGRRGGSPELAGLFVSQIDGFARAIGDRIVRPWRELVFATIQRPREATPLSCNLESESGIGDDVDPGCRRRLRRSEQGDVLATVRSESPEPVEKFQLSGRGTGCIPSPPDSVRGTRRMLAATSLRGRSS